MIQAGHTPAKMDKKALLGIFALFVLLIVSAAIGFRIDSADRQHESERVEQSKAKLVIPEPEKQQSEPETRPSDGPKNKPAEVKPFVQKTDQQCRHDYKTMAQLDVTCIALRPRSEVYKIIGRPDAIPDEKCPTGPSDDCYWFGWVYYEKGVLKSITYNYTSVPTEYPWGPDALEHTGLQKTSEPHDFGFVVGWDKTTTPLECCGLRMETAGMLKSIAQITIRFDSRIKPRKGS